ncbi:MAG: HypC/HybG/HupF family hydrogenase formation chaperone [bacterium]
MCLAVPGKIITIDNKDELMRTGKVDFGGIVKQINLTLVPEAQVDNYILVHAGFAIGTINEENAMQIFKDIDECFGEKQ